MAGAWQAGLAVAAACAGGGDGLVFGLMSGVVVQCFRTVILKRSGLPGGKSQQLKQHTPFGTAVTLGEAQAAFPAWRASPRLRRPVSFRNALIILLACVSVG